MASTYSTSQKFELIATGEKAGLWGTITNTNLELVEEAVGGYLSLNVASSDQALTISNGASSNGRNMIIKLTGTLAANRNVTVPDSIEKMYLVEDATTRSSSHYTLTFKTLPASPSVGDEVTFIDAKGTFGSNNLTVGRNSSNINSAASNLTVSTNGAAFTLVYLNATRGWSYKDKI